MDSSEVILTSMCHLPGVALQAEASYWDDAALSKAYAGANTSLDFYNGVCGMVCVVWCVWYSICVVVCMFV